MPYKGLRRNVFAGPVGSLLALALALMVFGLLPAGVGATERDSVEVVLPVGAETAIEHVAFSPDGKLLATTGSSAFIRIWDVDSRRLLRTLISKPDGMRSGLVFLPGERQKLVSMEPTPVAFDLHNGEKIPFVRHEITSFARSHDGGLLAGADNRQVYLFDARTLQEVRRLPLPGSKSRPSDDADQLPVLLAFDSTGTILAAAQDGKISIFDVETGKRERVIPADPRTVYYLTFAPQGQVIAALTDSGDVKLWNAGSGKLLKGTQLARTDPFGAGGLQFTHDGQFLLASVEDNLHVLNASTLKKVSTMPATHCPSHFAVAPNALKVACVIRFWAPGRSTAYMLDVPNGQVLGQMESGFRQHGIAFLPGSSTLFTGSDDGSARLWDVTTGQLKKRLDVGTQPLDDVSVSTDGAMLVTVKRGEVEFWSSGNFQPLHSFKTDAPMADVSFSPSPGVVFIDNAIINLNTGRKLATLAWTAGGYSGFGLDGKGQFSTDGRLVAGTGIDPGRGRTLSFTLNPKVGRVADARSGKLLRTLRDDVGSIETVFFLPDDKSIASVSARESSTRLSIWSLDTGRILSNATISDMQRLAMAVPTPDRRQVILFDHVGNGAVYDVATGDRRTSLAAPTDGVEAAVVSDDGRFLATITQSSAIRIWDLSSGAMLATIAVGKGDDFVTVTPEGFFDGTHGGSQALTVVRGIDLYSIDQLYDQLYRPDLVREKLAGDPSGMVRSAAVRVNLPTVLAAGLPPQVVLRPPGVERDVSEVELEAIITDRGGGIGKIEWRVNGVTSALTRPGTADEPAGEDRQGLRVKQSIALQPGNNLIEVVAYNARELSASVPATLQVRATSSSRHKGRLFVMAVGINDYFDSRLSLRFAVSDAQAIANIFSKAKGDLYEQVETVVLSDAEVTADGLDTVFKNLGSHVKPEDTFIFFVAGHGKTIDGRYYFLPRDFRYTDAASIVEKGIGQHRFQEWLARISAQRGVLIFDTCESGSLTGERIAQRGLERVVAVEKMAHAMGRTTIAAATDDAPALEGLRGHGVLTYALLQGLADADADGNGIIEVLELITYVDRMVPELSERSFSRRQIPQSKFSGSNFRLATRLAASPETSGPAPAMSSKPTHVVVAPADVYSTAGGGVAFRQLTAGSLVTVVATEKEWILVSRDGQRLGYVAAEALLRIQ